MTKKSFQQYCADAFRSFFRSLRHFPIEVLLSLAAFVLACVYLVPDMSGDTTGSSFNEQPLPFLLLIFFEPQLLISFTANRYTHGTRRRWIYYLSPLLWFAMVCFYYHLGVKDGMSSYGMAFIIVTYIITNALLLIAPGTKSNEVFSRDFFNTGLWTTISGVITNILGILILAIIGSVMLLFHFGGDGLLAYPELFICIIVSPLLACVWVSKHSNDHVRQGLTRVLTEYIFTPAVIVYTLVLYAYAAKILFTWELPHGGVGYMVTIYMFVAIAVYILQDTVEKRHFGWFFRAFPYIAIVPMMLLWVGTCYRISEYGFTMWRIYLLALTIVMTLYVLMLMIPRLRNYRSMLFLLFLIGGLLTYIPGISAYTLGIKAQAQRFERSFPFLLDPETGQFAEHYDYHALAADTLVAKQILQSEEARSYLVHELDSASYAERYGQYGTYHLWSDYLKQSLDSVRNISPKITKSDDNEIYLHLDTPVQVGEYTEVVPPSWYRGTTHRDTLILFLYRDKVSPAESDQESDSSLQDTIICMPITPDMPLAIYSGDYMAVFSSIRAWDAVYSDTTYRRAYCPIHALFRKPKMNK